ncbi:trehalose-phosphatase [Allorhizobium undicola]|uniref:trehalose-phosphatase n=1 Tax=Allorhizobium undicola TaxID=78527 RepID=UPI000685CCDF|nr:trehalose-phosphatase [Allorhizobium undicola]
MTSVLQAPVPHASEPSPSAFCDGGFEARIPALIRSHPAAYAVFFDIDGTLLDIAGKPDEIIVPHGLPEALAKLQDMLGGALALVTGRGMDFADQLFAPFRFPLAGLHGAERRDALQNLTRAEPTAAFLDAKAYLQHMAEELPGILIEDKGAAIAAHYRHAPALADELEKLMNDVLARCGKRYALQAGKMVMEIRPAGASKGSAVDAFLAMEPFLGRVPIAFGDDLTDEAMFDAVNRKGGISVHIGSKGERETRATHRLADPQAVRRLVFAATSANPPPNG